MSISYKTLRSLKKQRDDGTTLEAIVGRMLRIGIVQDVDNDAHLARVQFPDGEDISDWLYVLDTRPYIRDYEVQQRTEEAAGGSGDAEFAPHYHELRIRQWMPKVGDAVACLYYPVRNGDGFVLGRYHKGDDR